MRPGPLPPDLLAHPFRVRDAGISPRRLRALDLERSVWGVRSVGAAHDLRSRCRLFATRLRTDAVFSHVTAALLLGVPVPWAAERDRRLHVSVPSALPSPHARGIRGHHLALEAGDVIEVDGLRCTSPERTWIDLATDFSLADLVAAGDHLIHHRLPHTSTARLTSRLARLGSARNVRTLRAALPLLNDRAESPQESRLRVLLELGGLPPADINHSMVETESGWEVRPDFVYRAQQLAIEYQGDYHRSRTQWRKDMTRRSRLEARGWYVMELNADDLWEPVELVERIRSVLVRRIVEIAASGASAASNPT